jgi:hypothetical protein
MAVFTGEQAAEFIYTQVIPKTLACARQSRSIASPRARLVAQINCEEQAFGKTPGAQA